MRVCKNSQCDETVHTPDDRTGLIHTNGRYICRRKNNGQHTAAE